LSEYSPFPAAHLLPPLGAKEIASFLDMIEDGLQIWSPDGRLRYANPATHRLFGLPPKTRVRSCADLLSCCVDAQGNPLVQGQLTICAMAAAQDNGQNLLRVRIGKSQDRWLRVQAYRQYADAQRRIVSAIISTSVDITPFIEHEQSLQRQAQYDALTRLPNRLLYADRLHQALATATRRREMLAVCMMDLDGFKPINDRYGHKAGDRLLQEIAYRLEGALRADDTAARIGGDEFALLLGGLHNPAEVEQVLGRVLQDIARPVVVEGHAVSVTASIGVSLFPGDINDPDQLMRHADQAMYKAKEAGKGCFHVYDPAVASKLHASRGLLKKIQEALDGGQFRLYYQPKVDCRRGLVVGLEALVRWQHPVLGLRAPSEFLPLIEHDDAIIGLGEWVIREALAQIARWQEAGIELPVSVNIAARQFLRGNFGERLGQLLADQPPERVRLLGIEIVETAVLEDINTVSQMVQRYRQQGMKFDLDDFGTGYSSLVHLKRLSVDSLKIDQGFVRDMLDDPGDLTIVQGVINLASAFHLGVVAEGVENIEHVLTLLELGCDVMQGYVIARPMPAERVLDWVRSFEPDPRWQIADEQFPLRSDFDLLLARVLHRYWVQRLLAAAHDASGAMAWPEMDYRQCRLSRWYTESGLKQFVGRPELVQFDVAHREVHRLGQLVQNDVNSGKGVAGELVAELLAASESMLRSLDVFQKLTRP
jgi:diguanylate cyclase (GGDEF)-like protein